MRYLPPSIAAKLKSKMFIGDFRPTAYVEFLDSSYLGSTLKIPVLSLNVSRDEVQDSQVMTFSIVNVNPNDPTDIGYYHPYRGIDAEFGKTENQFKYVIVPGKRIRAYLGYASATDNNAQVVYTGIMDDVTISTSESSKTIDVSCRDTAYKLIDNYIRVHADENPEEIDNYYIEYPVPSDITPIAWLTEANRVNDTVVQFTSTEEQTISTNKVIELTDVIYSGANKTGTKYIRNKDYTINYKTGKIKRYGAAIPVLTNIYVSFDDHGIDAPDASDIVKDLCMRGGFAAEDVYIENASFPMDIVWEKRTYMEAIREVCNFTGFKFYIDEDGKAHFTARYSAVPSSYTFSEGEDIFDITLNLSNSNAYGRVRSVGNGVEATQVALSSGVRFDGSRVQMDKTQFIENIYLEEETQVAKAALEAFKEQARRYITVSFTVVGNPYVQMGDKVTVIEHTTTISEVYHINAISHNFSGGIYTTYIQAYHISAP